MLFTTDSLYQSSWKMNLKQGLMALVMFAIFEVQISVMWPEIHYYLSKYSR